MDAPVRINEFLLGYAKLLLADLPDERWAEPPTWRCTWGSFPPGGG